MRLSSLLQPAPACWRSGTCPRRRDLSSPTIYGTFDQVVAECAVFNGGISPLAVTVNSRLRIGETIGPLNCDAPSSAPASSARSSRSSTTRRPMHVATAESIANLSGGLVFHKEVVDPSGILVFHPIRFAPLR